MIKRKILQKDSDLQKIADGPKRLVAVNSRGYRIGETHPRAVLTDHEVDLVLELHFEEGWSYAALALKFEVSVRAVGKWCRGECRGHSIARFKRVP